MLLFSYAELVAADPYTTPKKNSNTFKNFFLKQMLKSYGVNLYMMKESIKTRTKKVIVKWMADAIHKNNIKQKIL